MADCPERRRTALDAQREHWAAMYAASPGKFGFAPSSTAEIAARTFAQHHVHTILELGCGAGRDAVHFARSGFAVRALDYAEPAIVELRSRSEPLGLAARLHAYQHDARLPLPFDDASFDGAFARAAGASRSTGGRGRARSIRSGSRRSGWRAAADAN